ncbi:unnamed protein product [Vitrella brassicaformis CCMP3155]|uniref:Uncharacterized protein n=1 Tax=Vitrella brassicaformis (strain CCMP3155) TaxID=1169540 RepID=A0A0G4GBB0_VITBC|nr:unnamed protein product [Vitrella brassicaformis CCMP3155]|eukprot:CEM25956.1 unnamed protein product [Vitrella brassicaformis CCMP3155]
MRLNHESAEPCHKPFTPSPTDAVLPPSGGCDGSSLALTLDISRFRHGRRSGRPNSHKDKCKQVGQLDDEPVDDLRGKNRKKRRHNNSDEDERPAPAFTFAAKPRSKRVKTPAVKTPALKRAPKKNAGKKDVAKKKAAMKKGGKKKTTRKAGSGQGGDDSDHTAPPHPPLSFGKMEPRSSTHFHKAKEDEKMYYVVFVCADFLVMCLGFLGRHYGSVICFEIQRRVFERYKTETAESEQLRFGDWVQTHWATELVRKESTTAGVTCGQGKPREARAGYTGALWDSEKDILDDTLQRAASAYGPRRGGRQQYNGNRHVVRPAEVGGVSQGSSYQSADRLQAQGRFQSEDRPPDYEKEGKNTDEFLSG